MYSAERDVADVSGFPTDYDGYQRELMRLRADPRLAPIATSLVDHPEHAEREAQRRQDEEGARDEQQRHEEDVRWVSRHREGDRWELGLSGDLATMAEQGGSYAGGTASFGLYYQLNHDDADETRPDGVIVNLFFGDSFGADLRVHFLHRLDGGPEATWITAVGLNPVLENRFAESVVRLPTYFGTLIPELGVIFRADRDPTWYLAWDILFSFLLAHDLAMDVAARVFLVGDWETLPEDAPEDAEDPVETMFMLSVGFRLN